MMDVFGSSFNPPIYVSLLAAALPAIFWMVYIYRKDKIEKEPLPLLLKLIFGGVLATGVAFVLEMISQVIEAPLYDIFANNLAIALFISAMMIGIIEELSKYFFLKKFSWNNANFNYTFDGLVFAVFVSLGFALAENILYVFSYGLSVAVSRAILTIPAHMTFGVFMGADYGTAKIYDAMGETGISKRHRTKGILIAILLHGIYDFLALSSYSPIYTILFFGFVVVLDIIVFLLIRNKSNNDRNIREIIDREFYQEINLDGDEGENSVK